jgi:NNP family nitrate/nitrite transporter-like MFS transporter
LVGLCFLRLFIGIAGSSFVMCQAWSTRMFTKDIVGTANALVGGWGNAGEEASEKAWRTVCVVPAVVAFSTGLLVIKTSEDCPLGNYAELKKRGSMPEVSATASFRQGAVNLNTWLLYIQYGCCFGVELTMNNAAATYFVDEFDLSTESASAIASIFGFMNLFARGLGGYLSDKAMARVGMKGRIMVQMTLLLLEGICIFIFALMDQLWAAILVLTTFSIFVQGAEGSTYGLVPYVNPVAPGAVAGIVGAGGPSGAVAFGFGFLLLSEQKHAYYLMASGVLLSGVLSLFINIKGHGGLLHPAPENPQLVAGGGNLAIPEIQPDFDRMETPNVDLSESEEA